MGMALVKAVYARWGHLDPVPKLVLIRMAISAKDADKPPQFYGGREALAAAIGRVVPDAPARDDRSAAADSARKERDDAFKAVERAVRALTKAGAVALMNRPGPGAQACYELRILSLAAPRSAGGSAPRSAGGTDAEVPPAERTKSPPFSGGPRNTDQEEDLREEEEKEDGLAQVTTSPAPGSGPAGDIEPPHPVPMDRERTHAEAEAQQDRLQRWAVEQGLSA